MPNGKKGYWVFLGKAHLGYYRAKKDTEKCVRESLPVASQILRVASTACRTYKYVQARKKEGSTVYYGVIRELMVQGAGGN